MGMEKEIRIALSTDAKGHPCHATLLASILRRTELPVQLRCWCRGSPFTRTRRESTNTSFPEDVFLGKLEISSTPLRGKEILYVIDVISIDWKQNDSAFIIGSYTFALDGTVGFIATINSADLIQNHQLNMKVGVVNEGERGVIGGKIRFDHTTNMMIEFTQDKINPYSRFLHCGFWFEDLIMKEVSEDGKRISNWSGPIINNRIDMRFSVAVCQFGL
jgi:hypothetical protein